MNRVAVTFSAITALLEDMHAVAVEGQASELSPDEMMPLVARLRADTRDLKRYIVVAATDVNR